MIAALSVTVLILYSKGGAEFALPPEKAAQLERIEEAKEKAESRRRERSAEEWDALVEKYGAHESPRPWPRGIFEDGEAPLPSNYDIRNRWQDVIDGKRTVVYAGGFRDRPSVGLLVVEEIGPSPDQRNWGFFESRVPTGPLHIESVTDGRLLMRGLGTGVHVIFDLRSRSFVG